jgi:hypothetical protein
MKYLTPLVKGLITGIVMLATSLLMYYGNAQIASGWQYLIYVIYAGGILWTLMDYARTPSYQGKFGELFIQGFRCFIVVTLVMVTFTGIFSKMHPEFAEESAKYFREELAKEKNRTPDEINKQVEEYKNQYTTKLVSMSIFGYLLVGSVFTAAGAGMLLLRRK